MQHRNRLLVGAAAGFLLALAAAVSVVAYDGQVAATITVSGPAGNVSCGTTVTLHALVLDNAGTPDTGVAVDWTFTGGDIAGDKFNPNPSITNSSGIATTQVTFACPGANITSNRVVSIDATSGQAVGSITVTVTVKGLPSTSTSPLGDTSPVALFASAFAVLAGGWIILRRISAARA